MPSPVRILQLSDPHLVMDPRGRYRQREPLAQFRQALAEARRQLAAAGCPADLLLLTGDLCQDETWGGYVRLREQLEPIDLPVAALPGNHDRPRLLAAALGRRVQAAPALLTLGDWQLLLLDSHRPGCVGGWLGPRQLDRLATLLRPGEGARSLPLLVAVHHPPVAIGDPEMDRIGLGDGPQLLELMRASTRLRAVVFGHVHQHWQGGLPGRPEVPLLGCPSTLCSFGPVQPCPLGRADDPGGRLLELLPGGGIRHRLLRWSLPDAPTVR